jgi:hypothetical protein
MSTHGVQLSPLTHLGKDHLPGMFRPSGFGAVPTKLVSAPGAAKQTIPALAMQGFAASQARNAFGKFLADQISEQAWFMTTQPHCKTQSAPERSRFILQSTLVATEGSTRVKSEPAPAALARPEEATLGARHRTVMPWDAWNDHQTTQIAGKTAAVADALKGTNERGNHMDRRSNPSGWLGVVRYVDMRVGWKWQFQLASQRDFLDCLARSREPDLQLFTGKHRPSHVASEMNPHYILNRVGSSPGLGNEPFDAGGTCAPVDAKFHYHRLTAICASSALAAVLLDKLRVA